jgi:2,3-bisphosphoglycerate-dependent phosphoglycerate mutase
MSTLILLRHGESTWNAQNRFTGWEDISLSDKGHVEAGEAGKLMRAAQLKPTVIHTSLLMRAIQTGNDALEVMERAWIPVKRSWRLNERHYGALQGLDKDETTRKYGEEQVKLWRRSYDVPPPPLPEDDLSNPARDERYSDVPKEFLPLTESLQNVAERLLPYWKDVVQADLSQSASECVLVCAHGNSLRALVMQLDGVAPEDVASLNVPTGIPRIYEFDSSFKVVSAQYLGDQGALAERTALADKRT